MSNVGLHRAVRLTCIALVMFNAVAATKVEAVGSRQKGKSPAISLVNGKQVLALGDSLADAQRAFPKPAGARAIKHSPAFPLSAGKTWGWGKGADSFEVISQNGKLVAISRMIKSPDAFVSMLKAELKRAKPTKEGRTRPATDFYYWESRRGCKFIMLMRSGLDRNLMGVMIGTKAELRKNGIPIPK